MHKPVSASGSGSGSASAVMIMTGVLIQLLVVVSAQPCNMFCPLGSGLEQQFNNSLLSPSSQSSLQAGRGRVVVGVGVGVAAHDKTCFVGEVYTTFVTPPVPSHTVPNVSSTLYSGVTAMYGSDQYMAWTQQTLDWWSNPNQRQWQVQAMITLNGQPVSTGHAIACDAGVQLISSIQTPEAVGGNFLISVNSANGASVAQSPPIGDGIPDSMSWQLGWGFGGLSSPDCGVISQGGAEMDAQLANCNGQWIKPNLQIASQLQSFCGLAVTATYADSNTHIVFSATGNNN